MVCASRPGGRDWRLAGDPARRFQGPARCHGAGLLSGHGLNEAFAFCRVHRIDQHRAAYAGGAVASSPPRRRQIGADDGQIVGIVAQLIMSHSSTPGLRFPAMSSQPRAAAQSRQMQVPATATGAR